MDGLDLKWSGDTLTKYFHFDKNGSLIPDNQYLQMEKVAAMIDRQNKADTGYYRRVSEMNYRTDVEFTNNPYGNSPTIGAGVKIFGPRPMEKVKFEGRIDLKPSSELQKKLKHREDKFEKNQQDIEALHASLEPDSSDSARKLLWLYEGDQMMTGGGFDGNEIGQVTESGLNFVLEGSKDFTYEDTQYSAYVVEGAKWLKGLLESWGLQPGSLKPQGAAFVRLAQESDGMIGWPVYAKALSRLTKQIATRLLIASGIDTRQFVDTTVVDTRTGERVKYRVVDAIARVLDLSTLDAADVPSIITLLARIQKHGWKKDDGKLEPKPAKTRSIYPNSAIPGMIEAMTMAPFNDKLKELKVPFMPSLQDKPTRVAQIWSMIEYARSKGYDYLASDWSKYDSTVKGGPLATIIYYAVRPFFAAEYQPWVDFVCYCLTYKYLMLDDRLCALHNDLYSSALQQAKNVRVGHVSVFGITGGLISGAKFTHVGGSMYGEVVDQFCVAKVLGYEPMVGPQAGDDTMQAIPISMIDTSSAERTYKKVQEAAEAFGLKMNLSKQMWIIADGEPLKVFLQDAYHYGTKVQGIGSIFRPYDAVFTSERNKGLSIAEQLAAEIARMNQGADSPFVQEVVKHWLEREEMIGVLFKEYGKNAFEVIIQSIGLSPDEIAQRIDVGSFSWGVDRETLRSGNLPILPVIAAVSAKMDFKLNPSRVFTAINVKQEEEGEQIEESASGLQTD